MRFSTLFQSPERQPQGQAPSQPRRPVPPPLTQAPVAREAAAPELPEDLDARVRLIGEWQLGEA